MAQTASSNNNNNSNINLCLILLVGLPGSGKTFLTKFLVDHFISASFGDEFRECFINSCVLPVTYDDYITFDEKFEPNLTWKEKRKNVLKSIENFVLHLKGSRIGTNLVTINDEPFYKNFNYENKSNVFLILDDNMYYSSMRFEYFNLARKYEIGFCQIYLETTLEKALEFNKRRDSIHVVPDNVIMRMYDKLETPNPSINYWERNSLIIPAFVEFSDDCILNKMYKTIKSALLSPEKYKNSEGENFSVDLYKCRKITDANLIHQLDLKLRLLVGVYVRDLRKKLMHNTKKVKELAEKVNSNRLSIMKSARNGTLLLPSEIVDMLQCVNKTDNSNTNINNYLLELLVINEL